MEINQFKTLLEQVNTLNNHYKKISDLTGENFNIFRILKLESSEVRLHSAFLAELLNPKGNHGQKDVFLRLFAKKFCFKSNTIDTESCTVKIENHIAFINEDQTEGGRIDILITDKLGNQIIIENKIYAPDQNNQLLRYYKYNQNADIIYLTLDGKEPQEKSYGNLLNNTHFKCYSYELHILNWLDQCRKEVTIFPIVRESITQYINLIKYLTNQTINNSMQEELGKLMTSNIEAAFLITNNLDPILKKEFDCLSSDLKFFCIGLEVKSNYDFKKNSYFFKILNPYWKYIKIEFNFDNNSKSMLYGFTCIDDSAKESIPVELKETLRTCANKTITANQEWWLLYDKLDDPYNDWSNFEVWKAISDKKMLEVLTQKIQLLLEISKEMTSKGIIL